MTDRETYIAEQRGIGKTNAARLDKAFRRIAGLLADHDGRRVGDCAAGGCAPCRARLLSDVSEMIARARRHRTDRDEAEREAGLFEEYPETWS